MIRELTSAIIFKKIDKRVIDPFVSFFIYILKNESVLQYITNKNLF